MKGEAIFIEIVGWLGSAMVVMAYLLNIRGRLSSGDIAYRLLNIFGSIGLIVLTWYKGAWQSVVVNVIWAAIALLSLLKKNEKI